MSSLKQLIAAIDVKFTTNIVLLLMHPAACQLRVDVQQK